MTFLATQPKLSERQFSAQVIQYAELMGWRVYHTWRSDHSPAGFPDLVMVRARHPKPRVVWAELKADRNHATEHQQDWIDDLRACGCEVYLWKPRDWKSIERILAR